jgi:plastocyanin
MQPARRLPLVASIALAALLAACDRSGPAYDLPPGIYGQIIDMTTTLGFSPQTVTIKAGEAVLWRNQSLFAHTVALPVGVEPFGSGDIPQGETFARKFAVPGTYRYICRHHQDANMEGTIIVMP